MAELITLIQIMMFDLNQSLILKQWAAFQCERHWTPQCSEEEQEEQEEGVFLLPPPSFTAAAADRCDGVSTWGLNPYLWILSRQQHHGDLRVQSAGWDQIQLHQR